MKQFALTIIALSCFFYSVQAKVWTVDNTGKVADYNNTTSAISAAQDGDTLLIGGGGAAYANITLSKQLVIIGTGYFLTENPNTIENKGVVIISIISFQSGSDGSELVGVTCYSITIATDNITVRRCYGSSTAAAIVITGNNNIIKQCYFYRNYYNASTLVNISGINNTLRNCYFYRSNSRTSLSCGPSNIIENNIFGGGNIYINSSAFGNNIITSGTASFTNCDPYNSISNSDQLGTLNGNQSLVSMTNVFVSTGTTDGKWQLASSSPAIGAGLGGIDCGMYGGNDPYVLSGIADIPVITAITVPARASVTNGLNVQVNIRSNK